MRCGSTFTRVLGANLVRNSAKTYHGLENAFPFRLSLMHMIETSRMDFDWDGDQGFLLDLERAAKGLSIGSDGSSIAKLRQLFQEAESDLGASRQALTVVCQPK